MKDILIFVILIYGINAQKHETILKLERGLDELWKNGHLNQNLYDVANEIKTSFESNSSNFKSELLCDGCVIAGNTLLGLIRNGAEREELVTFGSELCTALELFTEDVCVAMIELNIDIAIYIAINKPELNGENGCPIILQEYGCIDPHPLEWSIQLHEGKTIEKPMGSKEGFKILHLSDIHYDGTYTPGSLVNCPFPVCCEFDSGNVTDPSEGAGYWNEYQGCDVPMHTLLASVNSIKEQHNDIDFVYFTGDIISHRYWLKDKESNIKDLEDVLNVLDQAFDVPIYSVVGNHEPHPVNTWSPEDVDQSVSNRWIFDTLAELWKKWLPEDTQETIKRGAYYTVLLRPGFRLVALNSALSYPANWWLVYNEIDPFDQLEWFENVLHSAEMNNESVHVLSHIASGEGTCFTKWGKQFRRIIQRYANTVTGIFNGHTHTDELVLYYTEDQPDVAVNVAWNGGSLTSNSNKNPNYKILWVDKDNFDILDFDTWAYNVTEANLNPDRPPQWYKVYSFKEAYDVQDLSPSQISELTVRMTQNHSLLDLYYRYASREADPDMFNTCNDDCKKAKLCRMVVSLYNDNVQCSKLLEMYDQV